jgi:GNAT superfamily N-acetyltransferase
MERRSLGDRVTLCGVVLEIRVPTPDEREVLRDIERVAGALFAQVGLDDVARHEPETVEALAEYVADGRAWVILEDGASVGYALVDIVDGLVHLEQLSVRPDRGRRGVGTALLRYVCAWARDRRFAAVTLTTFTAVPWNAPFYGSRGFRVLDDAQIGPELRALRDAEAAHGLDPDLRVCMRCDLQQG